MERELFEVVGAERFELPTLWSQTRCATRLRYAPTLLRTFSGCRNKGAIILAKSSKVNPDFLI